MACLILIVLCRNLPTCDEIRIDRYASQSPWLNLPFHKGMSLPPLCSSGSWPCRRIFRRSGYMNLAMRAGCILQISPGIWSGPVALPDLTWRKAASRSDSVGNSSTSRTNLSARRSFKLCHQSLRCSEDDIRSPPSIVLKKEIHLSKAICGSGQIWPSSMESCGNGRWLLDLALLLPMNGLSVCKIADAEAPVPSSSMRSAMPLHLAIRSDDLSRLA